MDQRQPINSDKWILPSALAGGIWNFSSKSTYTGLSLYSEHSSDKGHKHDSLLQKGTIEVVNPTLVPGFYCP